MQFRRVDNPPNPFESRHAEFLEEPPQAMLTVYEEAARSILTRNDSPDIPFTWSVNPYRGCQHACAYCYARPYHEYLGYGAGSDFDSRIVVKINAADLLRKELSAKRWTGEGINFSGITDCYQPLEAGYEITRKCLQVCAEAGNPAFVVTKGFLVVRDIDVLTRLNKTASCAVWVSIPFADAATAKIIEPAAPPPQRRFEAVRRLSQAGIPVGVMIAPIIPGLSDTDIPSILEQAAEAGARTASYTALRLPGSVEDVFLRRLREAMPLRADRVIGRIRDMRGGSLNDTRFGHRMRGSGAYWDSIRSLFTICRNRLGLTDKLRPVERKTELGVVDPQPSLFDTVGSRDKSQLQFEFPD